MTAHNLQYYKNPSCRRVFIIKRIIFLEVKTSNGDYHFLVLNLNLALLRRSEKFSKDFAGLFDGF